ncbi:FG-GAP-like repeat-containing protein [Bradyrhizobium sp. HKCCYLRH3099]|uniref:FG-GAP-like repeat-containing protein n=1 Tax=unclassified Bradyrhizobium TaxID=2631580 RepID=UPI003EBCB36E
MATFFTDALPVAISGQAGATKVSLLDVLQQAYGDGASAIQSLTISYMDPNQMTSNTRFWDPAHPVVSTVLNNGVDIQAGHNVTVDAAHFKDVQIAVGNNITSNIFFTVPESTANGDFVGHTLNVTTLPQNLDANLPADHVPTANDIVSAARMFATIENGVAAPNDCHNIATAIAASAGATLDPNSANTANPAANEDSGFWRIAYRGSDAGAVDDWQSKVQAGDVVRMARTDGGVHTVTVTAGLNADGHHPGQIEVVDNWNGIISQHWTDYDNNTVKGSVTVYRIGSDGHYLTDQSADSHNNTILGSQFNDVLKGGSGNDMLRGGHGNDIIDGGAGDDTVAFSGKQSDYKIAVNGGSAVITDLRGGTPDGSDTITHVEHMKFADATVNFGDLKSAPAPVPAPVAGSVSISDVSIAEGADGSKVETFTVTRSGGSAAFDVHFATADGSATTADHDYVGKSGDLHFDAGVNSQTISVTINGDAKAEGDESFSVNLSAATNGAKIADAQGIGTIVNDDVAPPAHQDPPQVSDAHAGQDFNGDGMSDILFRNTHNGSVALWELDGNHITSNTTVGSAGLNWHADGVGDFNGDGKSDMLWVSDTGSVATWQLDGDHIEANQTVGSVSKDWHVAGVADFDGDGKSDVLWQNDSGKVALWEMNGNHIEANQTVGNVAAGWHIEATADFNGDGKADILLQNDAGKVALWQMDGSHIESNQTIGSVSSAWHVAAADDFNGDGKADVLWQNDDGRIAMWQMDGNHIDANTTVGKAAGWNVVGTGDVNHDGKADILFENAGGRIAEWQMNGDHIDHNLSVGSVSTDWHVV